MLDNPWIWYYYPRMAFKGSKVDLVVAQHLLDGGKTVREVAISQGVSTQAIYRLLARGTLTRPDQDSSET